VSSGRGGSLQWRRWEVHGAAARLAARVPARRRPRVPPAAERAGEAVGLPASAGPALNAAVPRSATDYRDVSTEVSSRVPGEFAEKRFRERRNAWLRRVWWVFSLMAIAEIAVVLIFAVIFGRAHPSLYVGLVVGLAAATVLVVADSPPQHIERWRQGARGEKATARALRSLIKDGWVLVHDLPRASGGNIDHVLVGPGGVYLLESKDLAGVVSVSGGTLSVRWREDPHDGYDNQHVAPRVRAAAAELSASLRRAGDRRVGCSPSWCSGPRSSNGRSRVTALPGCTGPTSGTSWRSVRRS
jgi:hypothetical protein